MIYGVICEFNPFHSGHRYLIDSIKKESDAVICAMSGNFVQRGEPAVYDKFTRAKTALQNGADLVIEIPTVCSTLSAQGFAESGVKLLEATGICGALAFGAECGDIDELRRVAKEIREKDAEIKAELEKGCSYPAARQNVIGSPLLSEPNNILALEYLNCTKLDAVAIKRIGGGHDSADSEYSAGEIRKRLPLDEIASLKNCEKAVLYRLRTMNAEDFKRLDDVSEGLENRIEEAVKTAGSLDELYGSIKTKRYTHSRIRRIILRAFLGIDKDTVKTPQYIRILGFNEKGRELLGEMKKAATLPIITKYGDAKACGRGVLEAFEKECGFTDLYNIMYKAPKPCGTELTNKIIIL